MIIFPLRLKININDTTTFTIFNDDVEHSDYFSAITYYQNKHISSSPMYDISPHYIERTNYNLIFCFKDIEMKYNRKENIFYDLIFNNNCDCVGKYIDNINIIFTQKLNINPQVSIKYDITDDHMCSVNKLNEFYPFMVGNVIYGYYNPWFNIYFIEKVIIASVSYNNIFYDPDKNIISSSFKYLLFERKRHVIMDLNIYTDVVCVKTNIKNVYYIVDWDIYVIFENERYYYIDDDDITKCHGDLKNKMSLDEKININDIFVKNIDDKLFIDELELFQKYEYMTVNIGQS
jgi:hypothetical protein